MKKILMCCSLVLILASCASYPKPFATSTKFDYSQFKAANVYVTQSPSVNFEYEALGEVQGISYAGYDKKQVKSNTVKGSYAVASHYVAASSQIAIKKMIEELKAMGANGIINLHYSYIPDLTTGMKIDKVVISGMAIVRK